MPTFKPIDLDLVKTVPIAERKHKVGIDHFARPVEPGVTVKQWLDRLPDVLAARDLRSVVDRWVSAVQASRTVILAMGAHPIKCGLNPVILSLMEAGAVSALAMNGAGSIHDLEVALIGATSEHVEENLHRGTFGMARETGHHLHAALEAGLARGWGYGEALGHYINDQNLPHAQQSLLARGHRLGVPCTVHVAMGTDTVHHHPDMSGATTGEMTQRDFLRFAGAVRTLASGVFLNLGSAVILPEVFLKAVSVCANLDGPNPGFTTVDLDMQAHYRTTENVVRRPPGPSGHGYRIIGHHEIMFPLLAQCVLDRIER